jgi:hypothetical protein
MYGRHTVVYLPKVAGQVGIIAEIDHIHIAVMESTVIIGTLTVFVELGSACGDNKFKTISGLVAITKEKIKALAPLTVFITLLYLRKNTIE